MILVFSNLFLRPRALYYTIPDTLYVSHTLRIQKEKHCCYNNNNLSLISKLFPFQTHANSFFHPYKLSPRCYAPSYATIYIHVHHKINLKLQRKKKKRDNTTLEPVVRTLISPRKDSFESFRVSLIEEEISRFRGSIEREIARGE